MSSKKVFTTMNEYIKYFFPTDYFEEMWQQERDRIVSLKNELFTKYGLK
jgi:hypothetical protein